MKKHIIAIGGVNGSGKSTAGVRTASKLNYKHYSSGDYARSLAKENGYTKLSDFLKDAEFRGSRDIDEKIDAWVIEKGKEDNFVMDSRLAFHFLPNVFKVFLTIDPQKAAARSFVNLKDNPLRAQGESAQTFEEMEQDQLKRQDSDITRYRTFYDIDNYTKLELYDLVIDTGLPENSIDRVPEIIIEAYQKWLQN